MQLLKTLARFCSISHPKACFFGHIYKLVLKRIRLELRMFQTAMHKAAFLSSYENVKALLELGASPNYRDPIGLTPLYYNMLTTDSNDQVRSADQPELAWDQRRTFLQVAEMLLREAADIGVTDMHGNHEIHQVSGGFSLWELIPGILSRGFVHSTLVRLPRSRSPCSRGTPPLGGVTTACVLHPQALTSWRTAMLPCLEVCACWRDICLKFSCPLVASAGASCISADLFCLTP